MKNVVINGGVSFVRSVILIGMPGSGKSTIGRSVAESCDMRFIDTDDLLKEKLGMSLQEYIDVHGRDAFAKEEERFLTGFETGEEKVVVATGGSAVLYPEAVANLKKQGTVVFLDCDLPTLKKRLWNFESRGIVLESDEDKEKAILDLYMEREPLYYKACDVRIDQNRKSRNAVVKQLISEVRKYEADKEL